MLKAQIIFIWIPSLIVVLCLDSVVKQYGQVITFITFITQILFMVLNSKAIDMGREMLCKDF